MSGTYIIVCAPAGTGLSGAVNKLAKALGGSADVECADVESELCHSQDTRVALSSAIKFKSGDSPIMRDVTFYLPRDQVTGLCSAAVKAALDKLENSTKRYKLLSCHFIYYG